MHVGACLHTKAASVSSVAMVARVGAHTDCLGMARAVACSAEVTASPPGGHRSRSEDAVWQWALFLPPRGDAPRPADGGEQLRQTWNRALVTDAHHRGGIITIPSLTEPPGRSAAGSAHRTPVAALLVPTCLQGGVRRELSSTVALLDHAGG